MFPRLLLLFTIIPFIELYLLVQVGSEIGVGYTIFIVILTGVVGAWLARQEGFLTMMKVRQSLNAGQMPADEMVEGLLILMAGLMLLTPGFITDATGLIFLLPFTRAPLARWLRVQFSNAAQQGSSRSAGFTYYTWHSGGQGNQGPTVRRVERSGNGFTGSHASGPEFVQGNSAGAAEKPRQTVVIDCEPVDDEQNGTSRS